MRRWIGGIVAAIWIVLSDAPFKDQIWVTVQETLGLLFDWTVFDWSEYHPGYAPEEISLLLPERFFRAYASIEENVLESFQDLRHRILTGQWPGETRLLEDRRVTYKQLRFELKDEKRATSVWNRCNPLVLPVQSKFVRVRSPASYRNGGKEITARAVLALSLWTLAKSFIPILRHIRGKTNSIKGTSSDSCLKSKEDVMLPNICIIEALLACREVHFMDSWHRAEVGGSP